MSSFNEYKSQSSDPYRQTVDLREEEHVHQLKLKKLEIHRDDYQLDNPMSPVISVDSF